MLIEQLDAGANTQEVRKLFQEFVDGVHLSKLAIILMEIEREEGISGLGIRAEIQELEKALEQIEEPTVENVLKVCVEKFPNWPRSQQITSKKQIDDFFKPYNEIEREKIRYKIKNKFFAKAEEGFKWNDRFFDFIGGNLQPAIKKAHSDALTELDNKIQDFPLFGEPKYQHIKELLHSEISNGGDYNTVKNKFQDFVYGIHIAGFTQVVMIKEHMKVQSSKDKDLLLKEISILHQKLSEIKEPSVENVLKVCRACAPKSWPDGKRLKDVLKSYSANDREIYQEILPSNSTISAQKGYEDNGIRNSLNFSPAELYRRKSLAKAGKK